MTRSSKKAVARIFFWPFKSYIRIIVVVVAIGLFQYQSIQIDILAREIRTLELKKKQLIDERSMLRVEIDRLTHINRIEKLAREKYGLVSSGDDMKRLVVKKYDGSEREIKDELKLAGVN
jgi:cell division protein FtsL